jgi:hypothetical protein
MYNIMTYIDDRRYIGWGRKTRCSTNYTNLETIRFSCQTLYITTWLQLSLMRLRKREYKYYRLYGNSKKEWCWGSEKALLSDIRNLRFGIEVHYQPKALLWTEHKFKHCKVRHETWTTRERFMKIAVVMFFTWLVNFKTDRRNIFAIRIVKLVQTDMLSYIWQNVHM